MKYQQLNTVIEQLPSVQREEIQQQFDMMFGQAQPLRLALVGAFSVGKSSLLNCLLNEQWLHTAQEEATALPTLIQYADQTTLQLVNQDSSIELIQRDQFDQVTTQAPEQAKCAVLGINQAWLKDVIIIDLPGLGSISEQNHAYTIAQIQQSDAILYLVAPRGVSAADLDAIQLIQSYGKHVLIVINRWDEIEQAITFGEKAPNLQQWQQQIQERTGYQGTLIPTHYRGLNHEKILDFIANAKQQLQEIRIQRFLAELRPQLENALGYNQQQQQANAELSEQQAQQLHQQLLNQRNQLIEIKQKLYQQQEQESTTLQQQLEQLIQQKKQDLQQQLQAINVDAEQWQQYINQGSQIVRLEVAHAIQAVQQMVSKFGEINLPEQTITDLNLRLPDLEPINSQDFLQVAQLNQLKHQLLSKQDEQQGITPLDTADVSQAELQQLEHTIEELLQNRQEVLNSPIPMYEQRIYDNSGSEMGRKIGEMLDWALILVPSTAVLKAGKAIGLGTKALKAVQTVQKTVKVTKSTVEQILPPQMSALNLLSIATWSEKIGGFFNEPSQVIYVPDAEAQAQVDAQVQQLNQHIQQLTQEVERKQEMISQHKLAGFALQQKQKEVQDIEQKINRLQQELSQQLEQAMQDQQYQQQQMVQNYQARALRQWLQQFEKQLQGIQNYIYQYLKGYWNDVIDSQLATRLDEVVQLQQQIDQLPEQKVQYLQQLQQEQRQLQAVLDVL